MCVRQKAQNKINPLGEQEWQSEILRAFKDKWKFLQIYKSVYRKSIKALTSAGERQIEAVRDGSFK